MSGVHTSFAILGEILYKRTFLGKSHTDKVGSMTHIICKIDVNDIYVFAPHTYRQGYCVFDWPFVCVCVCVCVKL